MKKLFIGVVAALCCFALAAPALAEVKVGGMIQADVYYYDQDGEVARLGFAKTGGAIQGRDDRQTFNMNAPLPYNRINVKYTSDDKKIGGMMELRGGSYGAAVGVGNVNLYYAWIDWHLTNAFNLRIGRQFQIFAGNVPLTFLGLNNGHTLAVDYGNIHGTGGRDGIRAMWKLSDAVMLQFMIEDPDNDSSGAEQIPGFRVRNGGVNGEAIFESNVIPRLSFSLPVKIGNFRLEPSAMWLSQEYEGVAPGDDDSLDIWGIALFAQASFGPFTLRGEITYGENLGVGNGGHLANDNFGALAFFQGPTSYLTGGVNKISDTDILAFWITAGFNFGPFEICGIFGMQDSSNDGSPAARDAAEFDVTRYQYGLYFPIHVAKNFLIQPEIMFFDNGSDEFFGPRTTNANTDFGDEFIIGASFQLTF